eukprot:CAMPEP_0181483480 /NCGR_PEP_ID=MMETSP1110-20121109/45444_1 /TAXON_ID=174948 /ORGANISM="Symbiodinium sp., Strain CCMP421" /LENGTH=183 /DNA_ID=CAMNT_0023609195 /DNA_START=604 /DNA_END=1153 /DNA_ORIENTATION=-
MSRQLYSSSHRSSPVAGFVFAAHYQATCCVAKMPAVRLVALGFLPSLYQPVQEHHGGKNTNAEEVEATSEEDPTSVRVWHHEAEPAPVDQISEFCRSDHEAGGHGQSKKEQNLNQCDGIHKHVNVPWPGISAQAIVILADFTARDVGRVDARGPPGVQALAVNRLFAPTRFDEFTKLLICRLK